MLPFLRCLAVLVGAVPVCAQLPKLPEPTALQRTVERARRVALDLRDAQSLPGLSVAVATGGRMVMAEGFGSADLEQGVPATPLTRFRIGSLSKLLTIAAVARLHSDGELDLDGKVRDYVPYFPKKKYAISVRQLCAHTGGIRHYGPDDGHDNPRYYATVRAGLACFIDDPLQFEPGTQYLYSSYGYNLLSAVVEGASDRDFLSYLREEVTEPLGLRSVVADNRFEIVPHRTRFYHRLDEGVTINTPQVDNSYKWASGGLLSNAEDLVRFGLAHLEPGFFDEATLATIFTPQPGAAKDSFSVCLGWRVSEVDGVRYYHHGGASAGCRAFLLLEPGTKTVVALLANRYAAFGFKEARELATLFKP